MLKRISFILTVLMAVVLLSHTGVGSHPVVNTITRPFKIDPVLATEEVTWPDSDGDGCGDVQEMGSNASKGGLRDPADRWDFFDVASNNEPPDGVVDTMDAMAVAFRWPSKVGDILYDSRYDRSVQLVNGPFDLGPPDGAINFQDLQALYAQFGAACPRKTSLSEIAPLCDWNLKEATDPAATVLVPDKSYKECRLVRDQSGKLVDVTILNETTAITDVAYSSDPVVPSQVAQGIAPKAPSLGLS